MPPKGNIILGNQAAMALASRAVTHSHGNSAPFQQRFVSWSEELAQNVLSWSLQPPEHTLFPATDECNQRATLCKAERECVRERETSFNPPLGPDTV